MLFEAKKVKRIEVGGKSVALKKGMFGYRVVHPVRDENGKIVPINLLVGGWGNFFKLLFILLVMGFILFGVNEVLRDCRHMADNLCIYCEQQREFDSRWLYDRSNITGAAFTLNQTIFDIGS